MESYQDYRNIFGNNTVPVSCCDGSAKNASDSNSKIDCDIVVQDVTPQDVDDKYIYSKVMVW